MEASEASKEILFFRELLRELGYPMSKPTVVYEDNKSCIAFSKNNTNHDRSKHIDIRAYALRDRVKEGVVELVHIDTKNQLADMLTKTQPKSTFLRHVDKLFGGSAAPKKSSVSVYVVKSARVCGCSCVSCFVR